jgi:hypothetical protein
MGGPGTRPYKVIYRLQGAFPAAPPRLYHTKPLLLRCCPSYKGLNMVAPWGATVAHPHCPVVARAASNPCMTWSPRMNSSVILATNTRVVSGRHPRVSFMKASFKMGRVYPDAVCKAHCVGSLSRAIQWDSGQTMVEGALVSMVTRYAFSPIRPLACRLSWTCFSDALRK